MGTRWTQWTNTELGFAQWVDFPKARACAQHALSLASQRGRVQSQSLEAQLELVRSVWTWVGRAYQSIDMPPIIDPPYRIRMLAEYGNLANISTADTIGQRIGQQYGFPVLRVTNYGDISNRLRDWLSTLPVGRDRFAKIACRVGLEHNPYHAPEAPLTGTAVLMCENLGNESPTCNVGPGWTMNKCSPRRGRDNCDDAAVTWETLRWNDGRTLEEYLNAAVPPLVWSLDIATYLAERFIARGPETVVKEGRAFALDHNARYAAAFGATEAQILAVAQVPPTTSSLGQAIRAMSTSDRQALAATETAIGLVMAGIATIPGGVIVTAVYGAARAVGAVAAELLPAAEGYIVDRFGRREPVIEVTSISDGDIEHEPRFTIPDPPGYSDAINIFLPIGNVAQDLPGMADDVQRFLDAANIGSCEKWSTLPQSERDSLMARFGGNEERQKELAEAIRVECKEAPPPPPPPPVTMTPEAFLRAVSRTCAQWRVLSPEQKGALIVERGPRLQAERVALAQALETLCSPATPNLPSKDSFVGKVATGVAVALAAGVIADQIRG